MVIERADAAEHYFSNLFDTSVGRYPDYIAAQKPSNESKARQLLKNAANDAKTLASRLRQVNPLVIDYFLGQNSSLQPIGTLIIAWIILNCEATHIAKGGNINREKLLQHSPNKSDHAKANNLDLTKYKDDWHRFIIHKLAINCVDSADLLQNDVRFVTFNYDVSLERAIYKGLSSIELFKASDIDKFLNSDRVLHIYGKVRDDISNSPPSLNWAVPFSREMHFPSSHSKDYKALFDAAYHASKRLRVIDPHNKEADGEIIKAAKNAIQRAKCVYILGYGFDENNSKRLGLRDALQQIRQNEKCVLFTNFNGINRIKKSASRLFTGRSNETFAGPIGEPTQGHYIEMSTRDTYEALELDFDAFEEQLIAGTPI
jgi:hypothetical protein